MNILMIGNGFDLAHGLPTKYGDFLEFMRVVREVGKIKNGESLKDVKWGNLDDKIKEQIICGEMNGKLNPFFGSKQCKTLLNDNIWVEYFLQRNASLKENWIDFESEVSNVIQSIDSDIHRLSNACKLEGEFEELFDIFFRSKYRDSLMSYKNLVEVMCNDLNKLIN